MNARRWLWLFILAALAAVAIYKMPDETAANNKGAMK